MPGRPRHVQDFIDRVLTDALIVQDKWRVPASITIAQSALETNWGRSVKGNAYFGIKGRSQTGSSVQFKTQEVVNGNRVTCTDRFRAYNNFSEAANEYGQYLRSNPRFQSVFSHLDSPEKIADELQRGGYATDPNYAEKLKSIIRSFGLSQYDQMGYTNFPPPAIKTDPLLGSENM